MVASDFFPLRLESLTWSERPSSQMKDRREDRTQSMIAVSSQIVCAFSLENALKVAVFSQGFVLPESKSVVFLVGTGALQSMAQSRCQIHFLCWLRILNIYIYVLHVCEGCLTYLDLRLCPTSPRTFFLWAQTLDLARRPMQAPFIVICPKTANALVIVSVVNLSWSCSLHVNLSSRQAILGLYDCGRGEHPWKLPLLYSKGRFRIM